MNDKLMNIAMTIFFASIIINGFLGMLLLTPGGSAVLGLNDSALDYDSLKQNELSAPSGFISNTAQSQDASSFNPVQFVSDLFGSVLVGVNAINWLIQGFFLLEMVFVTLASWFPVFSPIFLSFAGIILGSKILLIGYAGSVLLKAITGGR